ncbi:MAG: hypothetical protein ABS46_07905 [Cytophagaceae bacterium SCN 52-12]|nr:MAG: hypothetical protein ABS46_07905 [Cytophagaceae bacterium SCN 52-12]
MWLKLVYLLKAAADRRCAFIWLLALTGCYQTSSRNEASSVAPGAGDGLIRYAQGFQIRQEKDYQLLDIVVPFRAGADTLHYVLLKKGSSIPEGFSQSQVIYIPVKSVAVTSNLHAGAIDRLEAWDFLVAAGDGGQLYSPKIREKIRAGTIQEIYKGNTLNQEKVLELRPDVLMVTGSPEAGPEAYSNIVKSGIPVIINSEWLENSPLGRAEWIKLMAALLDRQNFADHQFAFVESSYRHVAELVRKSAEKKPGILLGNEYQGTWYMPGGKSFMATLLSDAGAHYHWKDNDQTGGIPLNFEAVYPVALDADFWLNIYVSSPRDGKKELIASDSRYADFKSVRSDRLYSLANRVNEAGANDYWESSSFRPDLLLADYVKILHPDLLPEHTLYYCIKLD